MGVGQISMMTEKLYQGNEMYGMVWYGMVWYGIVWCGVAW